MSTRYNLFNRDGTLTPVSNHGGRAYFTHVPATTVASNSSVLALQLSSMSLTAGMPTSRPAGGQLHAPVQMQTHAQMPVGHSMGPNFSPYRNISSSSLAAPFPARHMSSPVSASTSISTSPVAPNAPYQNSSRVNLPTWDKAQRFPGPNQNQRQNLIQLSPSITISSSPPTATWTAAATSVSAPNTAQQHSPSSNFATGPKNLSPNPQSQHFRQPSPTHPQQAARASPQHHHGHRAHPHPKPKAAKPSVKHLTCYFWSEFGHCQWSEEDCLYAHKPTGKIASAPVQVEVGSTSSFPHPIIAISSPSPLTPKPPKTTEPAVAGRNAASTTPQYQDWRTASPPAALAPSFAPSQETLHAALRALHAELHSHRQHTLQLKQEIIAQCTAMLQLASSLTSTHGDGAVEDFVERAAGFVDFVAEVGRMAEGMGDVLGRVEGLL